MWDFCDTWRIFLPDHIAGAILLIVFLTFAAGFVLDRLAIRRGRFDAAKSKKEQ
jgi:hypothetical protein